MFTKRILSGVQPSGDLHLGNYLGAIKNFVALQNDYECLYCIVDLHAITVWQDPKKLVKQTREVAATFIAAGIDPEKNIIFNQSQVPEHTQLAWIFNCVARMGWLNRMTQFKDKAGKDKENVSIGLFSYPTLMAADILIYKATHVPVGEDQKQHLELCRDIAQKFNHDFKKKLFPIIKPIIIGQATRVMSLRDGTKKMSKSDASSYSRIMLNDDPQDIEMKIKKARTDSQPFPDNVKDAKLRPEIYNLISIYTAINNFNITKVVDEYAGRDLSKFKKDLSDCLINKLGLIKIEMRRLLSDRQYLDKTINNGSLKARKIAKPVINEVYKCLGLLKT